MICDSIKRMTETEKLLTVEDMTEAEMSGRSAAHTACWKYLQLKSYDSALEHAKAIINRDPAKPDGYVFKARALMKLGKYREAEETLLHLIRMSDDNELIKKDVEVFIKLIYELASVRICLLQELAIPNPKQLAGKYLKDFRESIYDLCSKANEFPDNSSQSFPNLTTDDVGSQSSETTADIPSGESCDSSRYDECHTPQHYERETVLISRTEYLNFREAQERNIHYEKKILSLEEELADTYKHAIKLSYENRKALRNYRKLEREMDVLQQEVNLNRRRSERYRKKNSTYYKSRIYDIHSVRNALKRPMRPYAYSSQSPLNKKTYFGKGAEPKSGGDYPKRQNFRTINRARTRPNQSTSKPIINIKTSFVKGDDLKTGFDENQFQKQQEIRTIFHNGKYIHKVDQK